MFDAGELRNLRREAEINHIDFSRAKIRAAKDGGYVVVFDPPLYDLGSVLLDPPGEVDARTAAIAEGEMLIGLIKIQRAERYRLRTGRVFGWSQDQISRRPLAAAEVDEYLASITHRKEVAKLQRELAQVLESNAKTAASNAGADELKSRYGLTKRKTAEKQKGDSAPASAKPKRAPSRTGAKV
ncbi:hypothetical protein ACYZT8_20365 [Pseudomonas sp. LB3P93]